MLPDGQDIGKELAGMFAVGEPVDDRDRSVCRQFLDRAVQVGADHHRRNIPGRDPCGITDLLPPSDLEILCV